jgi:YebC/PmpR family DNA-binding regulatory protein
MSGHSKWHSIKHKKGIADAKRGNLFTRLSKNISIAAKNGGDMEMNPNLRAAVEKAKEANMPKANIERAIKKGTGELNDGTVYEELLYEGYGPGSIALLVHCITDNKNRTISNVRHTFSSNGGNLGEPGSVAWMFEQKGEISVELVKNSSKNAEEIEMIAIEAGAEDVESDSEEVSITTTPKDFQSVLAFLKDKTITVSDNAVRMVAKDKMTITDVEVARKAMKLLSTLEDDEDVNEVYTNFDVPEELIEQL